MVSVGVFGKCEPCWNQAREIAQKIDFDINSAIQFEEFWIPDALFFNCEHYPSIGQRVFSKL